MAICKYLEGLVFDQDSEELLPKLKQKSYINFLKLSF